MTVDQKLKNLSDGLKVIKSPMGNLMCNFFSSYLDKQFGLKVDVSKYAEKIIRFSIKGLEKEYFDTYGYPNPKYLFEKDVVYYFNGIYTGEIKSCSFRMNPLGWEYLINGFWVPECNIFGKRYRK